MRSSTDGVLAHIAWEVLTARNTALSRHLKLGTTSHPNPSLIYSISDLKVMRVGGNAQDPHRGRTVNWMKAAGGTCTAFDMTTKGILHQAFEVGSQSNLSL